MKRLNFSLHPKQTFILFGDFAGLQNGLYSQHVGSPHDHFYRLKGLGRKSMAPSANERIPGSSFSLAEMMTMDG